MFITGPKKSSLQLDIHSVKLNIEARIKNIVPKKKADSCKRPYTLGRRQELSDHKRATILLAARKQLESAGLLQFTMETLANESAVTRQTVHNLFGTKAALLEALFDQIALDAGMERMGSVMQQTDRSCCSAVLWGYSAISGRNIVSCCGGFMASPRSIRNSGPRLPHEIGDGKALSRG